MRRRRHAHTRTLRRSARQTRKGSQTQAGTQTDTRLSDPRRVRDRASRSAVLTDACIVVQSQVDKLGHRLIIKKALRVLTAAAEIGGSCPSAQSAMAVNGSGAQRTDGQMRAAAQSADCHTQSADGGSSQPTVTGDRRPTRLPRPLPLWRRRRGDRGCRVIASRCEHTPLSASLGRHAQRAPPVGSADRD